MAAFPKITVAFHVIDAYFCGTRVRLGRLGKLWRILLHYHEHGYLPRKEELYELEWHCWFSLEEA